MLQSGLLTSRFIRPQGKVQVETGADSQTEKYDFDINAFTLYADTALETGLHIIPSKYYHLCALLWLHYKGDDEILLFIISKRFLPNLVL